METEYHEEDAVSAVEEYKRIDRRGFRDDWGPISPQKAMDYADAAIAELEAKLAERDRMLHNAFWEKWRNLQDEDEWMSDMKTGAQADLRARAEEGGGDE